MKVIYNSIIPFPGFAYMNLFGVLFGRNECKNKLTRRTYTHESIHSEQYKDLVDENLVDNHTLNQAIADLIEILNDDSLKTCTIKIQ